MVPSVDHGVILTQDALMMKHANVDKGDTNSAELGLYGLSLIAASCLCGGRS